MMFHSNVHSILSLERIKFGLIFFARATDRKEIIILKYA